MRNTDGPDGDGVPDGMRRRAALCGRVTTANATAAQWIPPREEARPVGPEGEISMAVGPALGNAPGGSSRDHWAGRCRSLLQRSRLRGRRLGRTRRGRVRDAAIANSRAGARRELAGVPCRSEGAEFQRVDQVSLRGNMTLRRPTYRRVQKNLTGTRWQTDGYFRTERTAGGRGVVPRCTRARVRFPCNVERIVGNLRPCCGPKRIR
jgi:hypothetical protein